MKLSTLIRHALRVGLMTVVMSLPLFPLHAATFQGIGDLPGGEFASIVQAVSADGTTAVGRSRNASGFQAIRWDDDRNINAIVEDSFVFASAGSVSADGSVIGVRLDSERGVWTEETGLRTIPIGVGALSADGSTAVGATGTPAEAEAALWTSSEGARMLGKLSFQHDSLAEDVSADGFVVAGASCGPARACEAFRWTEATGMIGLGDLAGDAVSESWAYGISADGNVIVGSATLPDGVTKQAFRWTAEEGMLGLGSVEEFSLPESQANAANGDGSVVVGFMSTDVLGHRTEAEAIIWNVEQGLRTMEDVLVEDFHLGSALAGWTLNTAEDISDDGLTIVGNGINPLGMQEGWIARLNPVPEPTSLAPLTITLLFACLATRRN